MFSIVEQGNSEREARDYCFNEKYRIKYKVRKIIYQTTYCQSAVN